MATEFNLIKVGDLPLADNTQMSAGSVLIIFGDNAYRAGTFLFKGEPGNPGPQGQSAYDAWLSQGNTGTIADFLLSLQGVTGKSAYEIWLEAGNTGSELDFLASLQGVAGKSIVVLPNGNYGNWDDVTHQFVDSGVLAIASIDIENLPVPFTLAANRVNITTGDSVPEVFGLIQRWFADLKLLAFKDSVAWSEISGKPTVPTKTSDLTNDSGFLQGITKALVEGVLTGNITSHSHALTKAMIEAQLTGLITTHTHNYQPTETGKGLMTLTDQAKLDFNGRQNISSLTNIAVTKENVVLNANTNANHTLSFASVSVLDASFTIRITATANITITLPASNAVYANGFGETSVAIDSGKGIHIHAYRDSGDSKYYFNIEENK